MSDSIFHLVRFLADDSTRLACLSGLFYGIFAGFMAGLGFSKPFLKFMVAKSRELRQKKAQKKAQENLELAFESGMSISPDGRFIIDGDGTRLCRSCFTAGREVAVTSYGDGRYRCPCCQRQIRIPLSERWD